MVEVVADNDLYTKQSKASLKKGKVGLLDSIPGFIENVRRELERRNFSLRI